MLLLLLLGTPCLTSSHQPKNEACRTRELQLFYANFRTENTVDGHHLTQKSLAILWPTSFRTTKVVSSVLCNSSPFRRSYLCRFLETLTYTAWYPLGPGTRGAYQLRGGAPRLARDFAGPLAGRSGAERGGCGFVHARKRGARQRDAGRRLQGVGFK